MYQIKESCSACRHCELACPVQAVFFDGSKYKIDRENCVECGLCETLCPTCSICDEDYTPTPIPHERIIRECDLVVCGGGSGLIAAIKAGQSGKKVILLEKAKRVGGNMDLSHSFFPVYCKLFVENGMTDVREEAVAELTALTDGIISREMIYTAVYGCSEFTDWLCEFPIVRSQFAIEKNGEKSFKNDSGFVPGILRFPKRINNTLSKDPFTGPGWMGSIIRKTMLDAIPAQKLDVEVLLEHEASHLLTDNTGKVTGVISSDPGGETEIHSNAVILATGGFGGSSNKLKKYFEFFDVERSLYRYTVPGNTGDAIDMLQKLGVEPDFERMSVAIYGPSHHPFSYSLCRLLEHPTTLHVNLYGKRWMDESTGIADSSEKTKGNPRDVTWGIYSQKNIDDIMQAYASDPTSAVDYDWYTYYQEDLDREAGYKDPPVFRADTIEDLAQKFGINPAALEKTVEDYNSFCQNGCDKEFNKCAEFLIPREQGPFYAIFGQLFSRCFAGGLRVDQKCRVLRNDNTPIKGLYACGDATSAMQIRSRQAVVSELSWAVASAYRCAVEFTIDTEVSV